MRIGTVNAGGVEVLLRKEDLLALAAACKTQLEEELIRPDQEQEAALVESLQAAFSSLVVVMGELLDVPARREPVKVAGITVSPI